MTSDTTLYAGIDGGGSKCSAMLFNHLGAIVGKGITGAANAARDLPQALIAMVESIQLALHDAGLSANLISQLHVGAGLAGASVPSVNAQLHLWQHPFASFYLSTDLYTACYGAHSGSDGGLLIIGTGSAAARIQQGKLKQFGGHGFLLGDKGSGAWFGRAAVASTLEAIDGVIPLSPLHHTIMEKLKVDSSKALVQTMMTASPQQFSVLAPDILALAQHDIQAIALIKEGVAYLDKLCQCMLQDTHLPIVLTGGLASLIKPWLSSELSQRIVQAKEGPEWGAMHLAQANLAKTTENKASFI